MVLGRITQQNDGYWVGREADRVVRKEEGLSRNCKPPCRGGGQVELFMAFQCQWTLDHHGEQLSTASGKERLR